ncbi:TlpA disulfide reductase family protein [Paludisphaera borealis]|uniref:Thiol-disulfide oxidoreductase ResA n=1 Tax=Paludisphaera borealis TaxID=1387353 RepID=A0A1U7CPX1_9BACT|nr:TlpA disulfide reductase family protein [Paludisphaera borealis]APW60982.1 Thiol-disulfide oxidoreductase ResA [Paludisphaera borealis]
MKSDARRAVSAFGLILGIACLGRAEEPKKPEFQSLGELNAHYEKEAGKLEAARIESLARLAATVKGDEAEAAYRSLFDLAVALGRYPAAEASARAYLERDGGEPESYALAASIDLLARAGRGEYDQCQADLEAFLKRRASTDDKAHLLPAPLVTAVSEAYLQTLIKAGRYENARKVCELALATRPDPAVKAYFEDRLGLFSMLGKPAPEIQGTDLDGKPVRLSDLKGKVVLIDFWATWCPPCVSAFPALQALAKHHKGDGFVILGVNLDHQAQAADGAAEKVEPTVRRFLLDHRAGWPNLTGRGADDAAKAYSVEQIPASFLVARDGTIVDVDLQGEALDKAVARAVGKPASK